METKGLDTTTWGLMMAGLLVNSPSFGSNDVVIFAILEKKFLAVYNRFLGFSFSRLVTSILLEAMLFSLLIRNYSTRAATPTIFCCFVLSLLSFSFEIDRF